MNVRLALSVTVGQILSKCWGGPHRCPARKDEHALGVNCPHDHVDAIVCSHQHVAYLPKLFQCGKEACTARTLSSRSVMHRSRKIIIEQSQYSNRSPFSRRRIPCSESVALNFIVYLELAISRQLKFPKISKERRIDPSHGICIWSIESTFPTALRRLSRSHDLNVAS